MEVREPSAKYLLKQPACDVPDWRNVKLGAVASFRTGPFGSALHKSDYVFGGVPVINPMQIEAGRIKPTERMSVAEEAAERFSEFRLKSGDVVIGRRGEMGRCAFVQNDQDGWLCGTGSMIVRPGVLMEGRFLQRVLSSNQAVRAIESASVGTTMINLNQRTLAELNLHIPSSVDEQSSIADALTDADALIDSLEQLLTKKRQIKRGAMQELLTGKRRLPGFSGEWVTCELRQLGHVVRGVAYNPDTDLADGDTEQTVRLLRSNNVQSGEIVRSGLQFVDSRRVRNDQYLQDDDLLLCMANGSRDLVGKTGRFERADEHPYTFGAFMACYRPDSTSVAPEFVAFLFQKHAFRQHVDLLLAGSSINNLRPEGVLGFTTSIPSEHSEQVAIAQVLSDMDAEITALESRLTKARALKQAMAQALLTGKIRLI